MSIPLNVRSFPYSKVSLNTLRYWIIIREPPDCIGNEPTPDINIGGSLLEVKKQNDKYMSF